MDILATEIFHLEIVVKYGRLCLCFRPLVLMQETVVQSNQVIKTTYILKERKAETMRYSSLFIRLLFGYYSFSKSEQ